MSQQLSLFKYLRSNPTKKPHIDAKDDDAEINVPN